MLLAGSLAAAFEHHQDIVDVGVNAGLTVEETSAKRWGVLVSHLFGSASLVRVEGRGLSVSLVRVEGRFIGVRD